MNKIITLLLFSTILFILGYNFTFNTVKTISKFISYAKYEEGTKMYKTLSSESNTHWVKICGIVIIIFALMLFAGMIILLVKRYCK
jgi:hypothetical protein